MNLVLFLTGEFFDEIREGKNVEYREVTVYWCKRLVNTLSIDDWDFGVNSVESLKCFISHLNLGSKISITFKSFDCVDLRRGYSKTSLVRKCEGITVVHGKDLNHKFVKPDKYYFVLSLGDVVPEGK